MAPPQSVGPSDPMTQMNKYRSYVTILADSNAKDEIKVKAAQELSENFEASIEMFHLRLILTPLQIFPDFSCEVSPYIMSVCR
jgi:hypothetical protein